MCTFISKSIFNRYCKWIMEPVVVILGATGTGKSKLAIELAQKFNGEIISADSMQIYKGLDVLTNKVTSEERSTVKHHMLDFVNPLDTCTVVEFRDTVLPIIKCIHKDKLLPIIVGGTHYYVESILWKVLVQTDGNFDKFSREVLHVSDSSTCQDSNAHSELKGVEGLNYNPKPLSKSSIESEIVTNENSYRHATELGSKASEKKSELKKLVELTQCVGDVAIFQKPSMPKSNVTSNVHNELSKIVSYNDISNSCNNISNEELLKKLEEVDPEMSSRYHPNDRRKILRSLEVWHQTGVRHSEHLRRQSEEVGGADLGGGIRFKNAIVLWITCEKENLNNRLDARVDEMLEKGLIEELSEFHASCNFPALRGETVERSLSSLCKMDVGDHYQKGIFQSIGLKEFHEYLLLDDDERHSEIGAKLLQKCVELMKLRTRQYAKRQEKWMKNRFLIRNREKIPVYSLDGNDLSKWDENVFIPATEIVRCLLKGDAPEQKVVTISADNNVDTGDKTRHFCDTCQRIFIGNPQWEQHMKSKKHRIVVEKMKKLSQKRSLDEDDKLVSKIQKL